MKYKNNKKSNRTSYKKTKILASVAEVLGYPRPRPTNFNLDQALENPEILDKPLKRMFFLFKLHNEDHKSSDGKKRLQQFLKNIVDRGSKILEVPESYKF